MRLENIIKEIRMLCCVDLIALQIKCQLSQFYAFENLGLTDNKNHVSKLGIRCESCNIKIMNTIRLTRTEFSFSMKSDDGVMSVVRTGVAGLTREFMNGEADGEWLQAAGRGERVEEGAGRGHVFVAQVHATHVQLQVVDHLLGETLCEPCLLVWLIVAIAKQTQLVFEQLLHFLSESSRYLQRLVSR
jgi:hypothetical protein